jgi:hypothetical protein
MPKSAQIALAGAVVAGLLMLLVGKAMDRGASLAVSDMGAAALGAVFVGWLGYLFLTRRRG